LHSWQYFFNEQRFDSWEFSMKWRSLSRRTALVLTATFAFGSAPGAGAAGVLGHLSQLLGSPVAASNDLDARQGSIHERLRDAMEAGRITDEDMHAIKDQLEKVAAQEATFKAKNGEMSGWQTMQLHVDLDRISKELESNLTERKGGPVDIMALRNQIATRLSDALAVQKLTQPEYDQFFAALTTIDKGIEAAKGPTGTMATNDQVGIALQLDNLSQRFAAGEHQRQADMTVLDKRKDELRMMIRAGVADGDLTEDEVDDLRQQLYNFDEKEVRMSKIGRPLTGDEELSMALELERFGAEIRARMDNGTNVKITDRTIAHRKAALDQTFANALFSGDISVAEATNFKNELNAISADEDNLRSQGGGKLTPEQIRTLLVTVEKLKGSFSRLTYNRQKPWNGVDGMVNDIKQKIAVASGTNRLTPEEGDDLQSKIADVLVAKSNERNVQGFVTTDSALKLAAEINTLADEVTKTLSDRSVVSLASVQKYQQKADSKIASGIDTGKLTTADAVPIVAQYKAIVTNVAKLKAAGSTDTNALASVTTDLIKLLATIKESQNENVLPLESLDQLKNECDREITLRGFNGKLTPAEAKTYRSEYNRISLIEKSSRARATGFDAVSAMSIRNDLTNLLKNTKAVRKTSVSP
jgi:hypothetical protein